MLWCVIRHPELGAAVVAEPSLAVHRPRGWVRVSAFTTDKDSLHPEAYPDLVDLDADEPGPRPDADQDKAAARTTKATTGKREN